MEKKNELKAGIFLAVGLLVFMAIIVILSGGIKIFTSHYHLKLQMKSVQGIGVGSQVTLNGVKVGSVSDVKIQDDGSIVLTMALESTVKDQIRSDSVAELKTQGALGDKFIFISAGSPEAEPLKENDFVKASTTGDLFELIASKGSEIGQIGDAVKELRILLSNLNADDNSKKVMKGLVEMANELKGTMHDVRGDNHELAASIKKLNSILTKIDSGQGTLGALINDRALYERIMSMVGKNEKSEFLKPLIREAIKHKEK